MAWIVELDPFLRVALLGFALLLTLLMAITVYRVRSVKLLLVTLGFLGFALKGLFLTLGLFFPSFARGFGVPPEVLLLDFAILVFLYAGMVKAS